MSTLELSRRRLRSLAAGAFLAWQSRPWRLAPPAADALCVNPSLTIAALAERAAELLLARAGEYGVTVVPRVPPPGKTASQRLRRCIHPA